MHLVAVIKNFLLLLPFCDDFGIGKVPSDLPHICDALRNLHRCSVQRYWADLPMARQYFVVSSACTDGRPRRPRLVGHVDLLCDAECRWQCLAQSFSEAAREVCGLSKEQLAPSSKGL